MSQTTVSTTDNIRGLSKAHYSVSSVVVPSDTVPQVEHQQPRRPIRFSDLQNHERVKPKGNHGRSSSPGRSWVSDLFTKRRTRKKNKSADHDSAGRSMTRRGRSQSSNPVSPRQSGPQRNDPQPIIQRRPSLALPEKPFREVNHNSTRNLSSVAGSPHSEFHRRDGEVTRHEAWIAQSPVRRKSVHLAHTPSHNYEARKKPKTGYVSQVTAWEDFIRTPLKGLGADSHPPCPESTPEDIKLLQTAKWVSHCRDENGMDLSSSNPAMNTQGFLMEHKECSLCGTPNSPCTQIGTQGIWLCTACRSPKPIIEVPPHKESTRGTSVMNQQTSSFEICEHCHTELPSIERDGSLFCAWCCRELGDAALDHESWHSSKESMVSRLRRQESISATATPQSDNLWDCFVSNVAHDTQFTTSSAAEKQTSQQRGAPVRCRPIPPLKDSAYISKKLSSFSLHRNYIPSSPNKTPPPPPIQDTSVFRPQTDWTPNRDSFVPNTPPPASEISESLSSSRSRPIPSPASHAAKSHHRPHKASSVYSPTPKAIDYIAEIGNFPFPPPPIPQDLSAERGMLRSSSIYPDDSDEDDAATERTGVGVQVAMVGRERSPKRDTSFYDYWEVILGEHGRRDTLIKGKEL